MSAAPHTPGPWRALPTAEVTTEGGRYVGCIGDAFRHDDPEDLANARLIAAAPELLEVCQRLVRQWDEDESIYVGCVEDARAAIAKAIDTEGKQ